MSPGLRHALRGILWPALCLAELAHVMVFTAVPLLIVLVKVALGIVFLPLLLLSFGDRDVKLTPSVDHLREPLCWIALAPCRRAGSELMAWPPAVVAPSAAPADDDDGPWIELPNALTWRHAWFILWLVMFIAYLLRPERKKP